MAKQSNTVLLRIYNMVLGKEENLRSSYNAAKVITSEGERIHSGNAWKHFGVHVVTSGSSLDHLVIPTSGGAVDLHMSDARYHIDAGPSELFIYEAPFTDANSLGTEVTSSFENRKRAAANTRGFTAYQAPFTDANSMGLQIDYDAIVSSLGGGSGAFTELMLDNSKQYLFRLTSNNGVNSYVSANYFMYRADDV